MRVGIFDSGLGGLTVVQSILEHYKCGEIFYIADTKFAPYGEKTKEQILKHSFHITKYLIQKHNIDALVVACNTATSASIKELRDHFKDIIVIGTEPGLKPAIIQTKTNKIGVLATPATLSGDKYHTLLQSLSSKNNIEVYEQACIGLVQQIEDGKIEHNDTFEMMEKWLIPMKNSGVDTIVLGCTHYPLISNIIKKIMGDEIVLIQTGNAIAKRLETLGDKSIFNNVKQSVNVFYTGKINKDMLNILLKNYNDGGIVHIKERDE